MAHGQPDFGVSAPKSFTYGGQDIAELAARLDSLSRYDRLGDVVFLEDFEHGIGSWEPTLLGTGAAVDIVTERKATGGSSCRLTGGSDGLKNTYIKVYLPITFAAKYGIECLMTQTDDMLQGTVLAWVYTGSIKWQFGISYQTDDGYWHYYDENASWEEIGAAVAPLRSTYNFINSKFTFDISTGLYSRFVTPPLSYPISGIAGYQFADATGPHMELMLSVISKTGLNAITYVDSVIVTINDV